MKKLMSPEGKLIRGTFETLQGVALIDHESVKPDPNGKGFIFDYTGTTDIFWDAQTTEMDTVSRERLFLDTEGVEWKESELKLVDEP